MQGNAKGRLSAHFTLHSCASHSTLRTCTSHSTPHLTSKHASSSHLISALLISSHLFSHVIKVSSTVFISSEHRPTFLISSKLFSTHLSCSARQKALTVREMSLAQKTLSAESFCTQTLDTNAFRQKSLSNILCTIELHKGLPSTTLYYKACTKYFPFLLCSTKLGQSISQYYFVLQSLHKLLPGTTYSLLQKLAKSISQYYFVLQSLHPDFPVLLYKARSSTTLYYKACTKHFPVLLCTTKLAQSTSQYYFVLQSLHKARSKYYFVLQSLHKARPSTTLYYKAFTKYFPVLLCTTKLAQTTSQ